MLSSELALDLRTSTVAVRISDGPFVEGITAAIVRAATGGGLDEVAREASTALAAKQAQAPAAPVDAAAPVPGVSGTVSGRRRALVLGVDGQDGSYLAGHLMRRGYAVTGIGRRSAPRYVAPGPQFDYVKQDLADAAGLERVVADAAPDLAFHVAAVHGAVDDGFTYEAAWREMMEVNVLALHVLLEQARLRHPSLRVAYAGSVKTLRRPLVGTIDEAWPVEASCLYGIGKIAARELIRRYRDDHGVAAVNLILFNHDSPRRPASFLLPQIARTIALARTDPRHVTTIRTLDFRIDWSAADELMDLAVDVAERADVLDVAMASGMTVDARPSLTALFARYGLDITAHVREQLPRSDTGPAWQVSIARLAAIAGRMPRKGLAEIVADMMACRQTVPAGSDETSGA